MKVLAILCIYILLALIQVSANNILTLQFISEYKSIPEIINHRLYKRRFEVAIKPLSDRVLIEMMEDEVEKVGSLYVPDTAKEKPQQGKIIAAGPGKRDGKDLIPMSVKAGDIVLYGKYSGTEVKHDGKDYLIVSESDILAIVG